MRVARRQSQRGIALLTAIVLVALATMLAVGIAFHTAMAARRGASSFTVEQGLQFGAGAEALAGYALIQSARQSRGGGTPAPQQDYDGQPWTQHYPPTEIAPDITLEAQLTDESGKFNLNSLIGADGKKDPEAVELFASLLKLLDLEPKWADMMVDWIDTDSQQESAGAEDNVYTSLKPAYRTPNAPITSVSELMSLAGFGRERYLKLLPHVTALPPQANRINVCFASAALLDALESAYNHSITKSFLLQDPAMFAQARVGKCSTPMSLMAGLINVASDKQKLANRMTEQSTYFRLHTWVTIGTTRFALYSLMDRQNGNVHVIYRTFGTE